MNYYKNIHKLYLIIFFHNLIPAYVIERLFWQERGMNIQMVIYCEIIYAAVIILFEVPSGILSDKFGRKKLMLIGALFTCFEFLILIFANNFWSFALAVFVAGISSAAVSGTANALMYESLALDKREKEFEKTLGRYNGIDFFSGTIAALLGSVMAGYFGFTFNYVISLASVIIAFVITMSLDKVDVKCFTEEKSLKFTEYFTKSLMFFKDNFNVCIVVVNAMTVMACINYLYEFWQIYLNEIYFPIILFGFFSALLTVVRIPSAVLVGVFIKFFKPKTILLVSTVITAIGFLTTSLSKNYFGMVGMFISCMAVGVIEPVVTGYIQHRADSRTRATIDSFKSLIEKVFSIIIGLGFGYISTKITIFGGYLLLGVVCIILSLVYLILFKMLDECIDSN